MLTHSTRQDTNELDARDLLSSCSLHLDACIIFHFLNGQSAGANSFCDLPDKWIFFDLILGLVNV